MTLDLRIAARSLARSPGFTAVAVITLGLAIGANTAVFSLVDAALLRALPYRDPGALVHFWDDDVRRGDRHEASYLDYLDWGRQLTAFESVGAYQTGDKQTLRIGDEEDVVRVGRATASFFPTLGVAPAAGRLFSPEEDLGEPGVVVVSHELAARRFADGAPVVGRTIVMSGTTFRVIGVLPEGFHIATYGGADVWTSLRPFKSALTQRHLYWLRPVGRLKKGVTLAAATADVRAVAARLAATYPESNGDVTVSLVPLRDELLGPTRPILVALFGAVAFVLLVACANIASLLLVRGAARRKELAVRVALGAGRKHLVGHALAEGLLIALLGGAAGLLLSRATVALLIATIPSEMRAAMPYLADVRLHPGIVLFTLAASVGSALLFATVPALLAARAAPTDALKGTSGAGGSFFGPREAFVALQITLALALLTGAGLLVRSTRALLAVQPGFETKNLLAVEVGFPKRLKEDAAIVAFHDRVLAAARELPGVRAAATVDVLPLGGGGNTSRFAIEGRPPDAPGHEPESDSRSVSATYFRDAGVPLVAGRAFDERDRPDSPKVVIVNETLARRAFGSESPIGKRLRYTFNDKQPWREIVGVVGDARLNDLETPPHPAVYDPYPQDTATITNLVVRTTGDPQALAPALRKALRGLDPDLSVREAQSMTHVIESSPSTFRRQYPARVIGAFSLLALVLAVLGIYGVTAYAVARRTREIGIRVAVGARPSDVVKLVLSGGARLAALGVAAGLAASWAVGRALAGLLYGIAPADAASLGSAVLAVLAATLLATSVPALRALRVEPTVALRTE